MDERKARAWAEIDLGALEHNYRQLKGLLHPGCKFLGVVKSNAYGHGAAPVARKLEALGCDYLAVAFLDEVRELRQAGIRLPVLILGRTEPARAQELLDLEATQCVSDLETAKALSRSLSRPLKCHLKLDTGMGRLGFDGLRDLEEMLEVLRLPNLDFEGIFTHFSSADESEGEACTRAQFELFTDVCAELEEKSGHKFAIKHCASSGAVVNYPWTQMDMVRPGIALYGYYNGCGAERLQLRPVMKLMARVVQVRDFPAGKTVGYGRTWTAREPRKIAVLSIGYGDGYFRALSNRGFVDIHGRRCPIVGRVCMDMTMVDVTGQALEPGDAATVYGGMVPITELAALLGTISYELCCDIAPRIPRVYTEGRQAE